MIRTLMAAAAVSGLMLSTALAQDPAQNPAQNPAQDPGSSAAGMSRTDMDVASITSRSSNQWLGSQLMGAHVVGIGDEWIGEVSDMLVDKSGKIDALIVGVGGFLGLGAKEIALPMAVFTVVPANSGTNKSAADQFHLSMTKDELEQHAAFNSKGESSATTGAGSGTMPNAPAPSR